MSSFTRSVLEHSRAIKEAFNKLMEKELEENDKYIRQIQEEAKKKATQKKGDKNE